MRTWLNGRRDRERAEGTAGSRLQHCAQSSSDLTDWVLHEEERLVKVKFRGDWNRYAAWRDHLWAEMEEKMRCPDADEHSFRDEDYVVETAFNGDWAQYRACRDRLREELWQIMKWTRLRRDSTAPEQPPTG